MARRIQFTFDTTQPVSAFAALANAERTLASATEALKRSIADVAQQQIVWTRNAKAVIDAERQKAEATLRTLAAVRQGPAAVQALNNQREREAALARAGTTAETAQGRAILETMTIRQRAAGSIAQVEAATQRATIAQQRMTASAAGLRSALATLVPAASIAGLVALGASALRLGLDIGTTETQIVNLTSITRAELEGMKGSLAGIAVDSGRGLAEVTKGLYLVGSAGLSGAQSLEIVKQAAKGAAIGLGDTATVGNLLTSVTAAYKKENLSASEALDILFRTVKAAKAEASEIAPVLGSVVGIAEQMGVSFADVGASIATFTRLGVGADIAVTGLRGTLVALLSPTKAQEAAMASVGWSMAGLRKEIQEKGLAAALVDMVNRFHGNADAIGIVIPEMRALSSILGTAGAQGADFVKVSEEIKTSLGGTADQAYRLAQQNSANIFASLKTEAELAGQEFARALIPGMVKAAAVLKEMRGNGELEAIGKAAGNAAVFVAELAKEIDAVKAAVYALIALRLSGWLITVYDGFKKAEIGASGFRLGIIGVQGAVAGLTLALGYSVRILADYIDRLHKADEARRQFASEGLDNETYINQTRNRARSGAVISQSEADEVAARLDKLKQKAVEYSALLAKAREQAGRAGQQFYSGPEADARRQAAIARDPHVKEYTEDLVKLGSQISRLGSAYGSLKVAAADAPPPPGGSPGAAAVIGEGFGKISNRIQDLIDKYTLAAKAAREHAQAELEGPVAAKLQEQAAKREAEILQAIAALDNNTDKLSIARKGQLRAELERLRTTLMGLAEQTDRDTNQALVNASAYQRHQETVRAVADAEARLADQRLRTTDATRQQAIVQGVLAEAERLTIQISAEDESRLRAGLALRDANLEAIRSETKARSDRLQAIHLDAEAEKRDADFSRDLATAKAKLADAQRESAKATYEDSLARAQDQALAAAGVFIWTDEGQAILRKVAAQRLEIATTEAQTTATLRQREAQRDLDSRRAELTDYTTQVAAARTYGTELANILERYGLLSSAVNELRIQEEIRAAVAKEGAQADVVAIEAEVRAHHAAVAEINAAWAALEIQQRIAEPVLQAVDDAKERVLDATAEMLAHGKADWSSLWDDFKVQAIRAVEEWLIRWVAAHHIAQAEALKTAGINAAAGGAGGLGAGSSYGSLFAMGAQAAGSHAAASGAGAGAAGAGGAGAGAYQAAGTYAAYAFLAWVGINIIKGFTEGRQKWAEASTLGSTAGNARKAFGELSKRIQEIVAAAQGFAKEVHLSIVQLGDVSIGKSGKNYYVKDIQNSVGIGFDSAEAAMEYAKVRAIQLAKFGKEVSALVHAAIEGSRAQTLADLQHDIERATTLENRGKPEIFGQIRAFVDQFWDEWQWVIDTFRRNITEGGAALHQAGLGLVMGFQGLYDQLTGHKPDLEEQKRQTAAMFNLQKKLTLLDIESRIAAAKATILNAQAMMLYGRAAGQATDIFIRSAEIFAKGGLMLIGATNTAYQALAEQLLELEQIAADLRAIPDLKPEDIRIGGGVGGGRRQAQDDFATRLRDLREGAMNDAARSVAEFTRNLQEFTQAANAAGASTADRAEGERLMREALYRTLYDVIAPWLTAQTDFERELAEQRRKIEEARAAALAAQAVPTPTATPRERRPRKPQEEAPGDIGGSGKAIGGEGGGTGSFTGPAAGGGGRGGRHQPQVPPPPPPPPPPAPPSQADFDTAQRNLTAEFQRRLDADIRSFRGLGDGLDTIRSRADELRSNLAALGLDASETAERLRGINLGEAFQIQQGQLGVMDRLYGYLKGSEEHAAEIEQHERAKLELDLEIEQKQLELWGLWNETTQRLLADARKAGEAAIHEQVYNNRAAVQQERASQQQDDAARLQEENARRFAEATKRLTDFRNELQLDDSMTYLNAREQVAEAKRRLDDIEARAKGGSLEAREAFVGAAQDYLREFREAFGQGAADGKGLAFAEESRRIKAILDELIAQTTYSVAAAPNVVYGAFAQSVATVPAITGSAAPASGSQDLAEVVSILRASGTDAALFHERESQRGTRRDLEIREIRDEVRDLISKLERVLAKVEAAA